jgi:hypothetical protein
MRVHRPFVLPTGELAEVEDPRATSSRRVPHACEACGELTTNGVLCTDCEDRTRPHDPEDPYDVLGGDHGAE